MTPEWEDIMERTTEERLCEFLLIHYNSRSLKTLSGGPDLLTYQEEIRSLLDQYLFPTPCWPFIQFLTDTQLEDWFNGAVNLALNHFQHRLDRLGRGFLLEQGIDWENHFYEAIQSACVIQPNMTLYVVDKATMALKDLLQHPDQSP